MAFVSYPPIAAGPIFDALKEQVRNESEALQTVKVLEKHFSADFAQFRGVCDQLFVKIAKEHPESKKFAALYRDYTDRIFDLSNSANEDDLEKTHEIFEKIAKLGMPTEAKELLDKMFLATKGIMFKAKTPEMRAEYYKNLFVPTVKDLLKHLDKQGLNPKLHKEIGRLVVSDTFQKYLGLFAAFLLMFAGGIAVPMLFDKWKKHKEAIGSFAMGLFIILGGLATVVFTMGFADNPKVAPADLAVNATLGAAMVPFGLFVMFGGKEKKE